MNARGNDLTKAERDLYETLAVLTEDFEKKAYPSRAASPIEAIQWAQAERLGGSV